MFFFRPYLYLSVRGILHSGIGAAFPWSALYVVDSRSAAIGQDMVVDYAVKMKERGVSAEEIAQALPPYIQTIELWFMVDSLDHLRRGGRISGAAATFGKMLNIKPVLHVDENGALHSHG